MMSLAVVADADNALAAARACTAEQDDAVRLACYDRSLHRVPGKPATVAPAEAAKAPVAAAKTATAEQQFGMTEALARKQGTPAPPRPDKLQSKVVAVSHRLRGEPVMKLEDGQIWEVVEGETPIDIKAGDTVTIYSGTMGSYRLTAGGAYVRVHRVQ